MNDFVIHACEQVLRFTRIEHWNDLSEATKVQLGFNMGVIALGLKLTKEEGFRALTNLREGNLSASNFRNHILSLIDSHNVKIDVANVTRPF